MNKTYWAYGDEYNIINQFPVYGTDYRCLTLEKNGITSVLFDSPQHAYYPSKQDIADKIKANSSAITDLSSILHLV
jgi:hypothetical protein